MERVQAALARVTYIQVAVATKIRQDLVTYWPKFEEFSWGVGLNKTRATNKRQRQTSNPYFLMWIKSLRFGYIAQHKYKHDATAI